MKIAIKNVTIPPANIHTIKGKYVKISFRTPDLEVNVVAPVKLRARKAVTGGNDNRYAMPDIIIKYHGWFKLLRTCTNPKEPATTPPSIKPLVLKFLVGSHGRRAGKSTDPAKIALAIARHGIKPTVKNKILQIIIKGIKE